MSFYCKHLFFCVNQRDPGRTCCNNAGASDLRAYAKKRISELELSGKGHVRVNMSGCLGRCSEGPSLVIYPEGIWFTYHNQTDIDEIIERYVLKGEVVERLLMAPLAEPKE